MCFISSLTLTVAQLKARFRAEFEAEATWEPSLEMNGFSHPKVPIITNEKPSTFQFFEWGLLPPWAKDKAFQKNTLNARIETIGEKPSFKQVQSNRCLIPATGFYEWQWLDALGKNKQKYFLTVQDQEAFAFAGLWSRWKDFNTGYTLGTYTIITQPAAGLMREIHNSKLRMPWILAPEEETNWLCGREVQPCEIKLQAKPLTHNNQP
jgi:putative SOS response-associated peptidase YedK